jgi:hypothetical protein
MDISRRFLIVLCFSMLAVPGSTGQTQAPDKLNGKSLEAAASYSQSLAQWAFIIIGGSLVLVLGNSHRWPGHRGLRATYFLFLLAWATLARSIYLGARVQEANLAYLLVPVTTIEGITKTLSADLDKQIWWMFAGLSILCIWLLVYLGWSVFSKGIPNDRGAQ